MNCSICDGKYNHKKPKGKPICDRCKQIVRQHKKRDMAIKYLGAKCNICGYNKSYAALHFHHTNPSEKDFTIGGCYNLSWSKLKKEADKCILLCANCHAEYYSPNDLDHKIKSIELTIEQNNNRICITHKSNGICPDCGIKIFKSSKRCSKCYSIKRRKVAWPSKVELENIINSGLSMLAIGKKYGVSDNAVRKWMKNYGIKRNARPKN